MFEVHYDRSALGVRLDHKHARSGFCHCSQQVPCAAHELGGDLCEGEDL